MTDIGEVIDCWVNVPMGAPDQTASYLFPGMVERWTRPMSPSQLIDEMDAAGVSKAVIVSGWGPEDSLSWARDAIRQFPHRFAGSHVVDPRGGLKTVQFVDHLVRDEGFRLIRMMAFMTQKPYGDPMYYPVYSKCAELGVPVALNVGIPGPRVPSKCQDPFPLDEVCHFFPELQVIMAHGGEPWQELCVKLMVKWPNLHYMTSAFAPKYYPAAVMDYLNSRGQDRVMWASDHPIIPFERCLREMSEVRFRDDLTKSKFLYENANRLFFTKADAQLAKSGMM